MMSNSNLLSGLSNVSLSQIDLGSLYDDIDSLSDETKSVQRFRSNNNEGNYESDRAKDRRLSISSKQARLAKRAE